MTGQPAQSAGRRVSTAGKARVRTKCLDYALDSGIPHGLWGGLWPSEGRRSTAGADHRRRPAVARATTPTGADGGVHPIVQMCASGLCSRAPITRNTVERIPDVPSATHVLVRRRIGAVRFCSRVFGVGLVIDRSSSGARWIQTSLSASPYGEESNLVGRASPGRLDHGR
jgi:hypothetical protein